MNRNYADHISIAPKDRVWTSPQIIPPGELLTVELVDGGSSDMNVDGSISPVSFRYTVPADSLLILHSAGIQIVDGSIDWMGYGGLAALTNGTVIGLYDSDDSVLMQFDPIKFTAEFSHFAGGAADITLGAMDDQLFARYDFHENHGFQPYLTPGQYAEILIQDNLTALSHHDAVITGRLITDL